MTKRVTFADLEKLLLELGFVRQAVQGSHQVFQYQGQDVLDCFCKNSSLMLLYQLLSIAIAQ
jgi:hypothetical protein